ncbi:MAG: LLM class flavin-dependent oxidoreductase [Thermoplasmata archaeon]|nr:LLM class flavin-dependent oxidoreductase [Thermoplasmata archaeon]
MNEVLELADFCESAGLSALWVAEHHFHDGGVCPSPAVLLSAIAQRTRRLRLGSMVSVLPFHNPVEVAEEYAMVDRLSGGRLNLGVGSGYIPMEFEGFGVDPKEKRILFDRALSTVLAALRGEPIAAGGPPAPKVRLNVEPWQRPHPPVWVAVQRREAVAHVARAGFSAALIPYATVGSVAELAEEIREFRAALPEGSRAEVAAAVHIYVGEDVPAGRAALQGYLDRRLATQSTFFQAKVEHRPSHARAETLIDSGLALIGDGESVREGMRAYAAAGVDELLGIFDFGGLPIAEVAGSVRAVGAFPP